SFTITTTEGEEFNAGKLVFATGIKDILPDIKGFAESWGISLIHCPYCHGYEFRGKMTGIMANGDKAFHLASLVKNLTQEVTILTSGKSLFTPEQSEKLQEHAISVVETEVEEVHHKNGFIEHFSFINGSQLAFDAVYAAVPFQQHSDIPASLGCELTEHGYIKVDHLQKTTIPGVYACGDNSMMLRSVASAVAGGNLAGAMVNMELTHESF
ncbi:pyridine nucleotide-disulfide oxidoreductase, partial [Marivirga lumbricoides]